MMPESISRPDIPSLTAEDLKTERLWARTQMPIADAVDLLLKRMESNPEEFDSSSYSKWGDIIIPLQQRINGDKSFLPHLHDNECEILWEKYREVKRTEMHHKVMERILTNETPNQALQQSRINITKKPPTISNWYDPALNSVGAWSPYTEPPEQKSEGLTELLKRKINELKPK